MTQGFSKLWKISGTVYKEICFQSVFSLRLGAAFPRMDEARIEKIVNQTRISMAINKALITIFIAVLGIMPLGYWAIFVRDLNLPEEFTIASSVTVYLASLLFLLAILGLQVTTSLMSTKAFEVLGTLPISRKDVSKIALLSFIRTFDIPMVAGLIIFPVAFTFFVGSILGGLTALFAVGITEAFSLALTLFLAKFFYSKIATSGGTSKYQTIMRFIYIIAWTLPSFGIYLVMNFATELMRFFASSLTQASSMQAYLLAPIYPFALGFLISSATFPQKINSTIAMLSAIPSIGYLALAFLGLKYTGSTIRRICTGTTITATKDVVKDTFVRPRPAWLGLISKDLRLASRSPAYASVLVLPAIQTVIIVISFLRAHIALNATTIFGFLTGISFITLIVAPVLFSIETLASAYVRSLPLKKKTVLAAKASLTVMIYLSSIIVLSIIALYLRKDFVSVLTFGLAHVLSVAAACIVQLLILIRRFWKDESAMSNIYANIYIFATVLIPGVVICMAPITVGMIMQLTNVQLTFPLYFATALTELAISIGLCHSKMKS